MIKLVLQSSNKDHAIYNYHPDGGEDFGVIEYLFANNVRNILQKAECDDTGLYARMSSSKIEKTIKAEKALPLEFMQTSF